MASLGSPTGGTITAPSVAEDDKLPIVDTSVGASDSANKTMRIDESRRIIGLIPQNSQSAAYTTTLSDANGQIYRPTSDTTARTWTIDSNANVAYPIGTCITFINDGTNNVTIAITSDTLILAGAGTTGSRTLAQYGIATAVKVTSTRWYINGSGLT